MSDLTDTRFWGRVWNMLTADIWTRKGAKSHPVDLSMTPGGSPVSTQSAMRIAAVWACVRLRSETIGSLPLHLRDMQRQLAADHPLFALLNASPNADMCSSEFWQSCVVSMDLHGNAYAVIHKSGGKIISLELIDPQSVVVSRALDGSLSYHYADGTLNQKDYSEDEILHLRGFSRDGLVGLSTIQYAADIIGAQIDANRAASTSFKNNLKAGGFLEYDRLLTADQRDQLRANLEFYSVPENAGKYMILESGLKVANMAARINPVDAQLLESRAFGIEEICRIFGVPPALIGHTDKASSWASSLESLNMAFLTYSLMPTLRRIEQSICRKLLSPIDRQKYQARFSVKDLMRANAAGRAELYASGLQNGWISRNEVRADEDLSPIKGGDQLTVQLNMTTLEQVGRPVNQRNPTQ